MLHDLFETVARENPDLVERCRTRFNANLPIVLDALTDGKLSLIEEPLDLADLAENVANERCKGK